MIKKPYPLKFVPVPNGRVWGGHSLVQMYGKPFDPSLIIGESWEISGFPEDSSVVSGGYLDGNPLYDIVETYMDEIVGEDNYKRFGNEFPLLVKMLDVTGRLSVQVHPDDETAFDRHGSYGKSECWYVLDSSPSAIVYMGFSRRVTPDEFYRRCKDGTVMEVLNAYHPRKGDFFYIESGIVHSAQGGIVIAEVQQLSDVTYRLYDWGRENDPSSAREMHLDLAYDCINYDKYDPSAYYLPAYLHRPAGGFSRRLSSNPHFTATELYIDSRREFLAENYESFIIYFCAEGGAVITLHDGTEYTLGKGEWTVVPAVLPGFSIAPAGNSALLLEYYIEKQPERDLYVEDR